MTNKTPGQAAYEAFGATGGFTTVLLTPWVNVSAHTVARWERIAEAAVAASQDDSGLLRRRIVDLLYEPDIHPAAFRFLIELLKAERQ